MKHTLQIFLLSGLLFLISNSLTAQTERTQRGEARPLPDAKITGTVLDSLTNEPLIGASVVLKTFSDSSLITTVTDDKGEFILKRPRRRELLLEISYIGYLKSKNKIVQAGAVDLGIIALAEDSQLLGEIVVEGFIPLGEMKGDTLVFNAAAFQTRENGFAEDLIKKLPGVIIENGQVEAQGEIVSKILVDGREFFGNDPNVALKNLPADMIDQVEILDQQSDQSRLTGLDDGNYAKTINIITKSNMRNGYFGRANAGYGTEQRYMAGGNINMFKGDKRISILGLSNNINQQNFSSEDLLGL
ncbi:MAG TPA: TonB-dependent receptor, partial [Anditalea sp.]|nr:TonB-dependent receptor [Anditalea sp.]